tara:strand:+ start:38 stop:1093 length:1056 start_codon:yes stop_codon:yes gene_type:complete
MTDPRKYLFRMIIFVLVVIGVATLLGQPLIEAFNGNPAINGLILSVLIVGIIFLARQTIKLVPEKLWIQSLQASGTSSIEPVLLAPLDHMLGKDSKIKEISMSAAALRSVLDGVAGRLDENREIARYLIGLLIFLGLLGTFWGLLGTVRSVSFVIGNLNFGDQDTGLVFANLQEGLKSPLSGMSTAFSSSLFGLAGSLVLGFLDLQLGQASGRFYQDLENWLSSSVKITNSSTSSSLSPSYSQSISDTAANHLSELATALTNIEGDRSRFLTQITELNAQLRRLSDQIDEDRSLHNKIPKLEAQLQSITEEARSNHAAQTDLMRQEIRALGKITQSNISNKKKPPHLRAEK